MAQTFNYPLNLASGIASTVSSIFIPTNATIGNVFYNTLTVGNMLSNNLNLGSSSMFSGSFSASNNQASPSVVTGLIFNSSNINYFECILTVNITTSVPSTVNAVYTIRGNFNASGWAIAVSYIGDNTGITFSINTSTGQISYTSTNISFWTSNIFRYRVEQITNTGTYTSLIAGATTSNYSFSTLQILSTTDALPNNNIGALSVSGGVTIAKELFVGGSSFFNTGGSLGINTTNPRTNLEITQSSSTTGMMLYSGANDGGVNRIIFNHSNESSTFQKVQIQTQALGGSQFGKANFAICLNTENDATNATFTDSKFFISGSSGNVGINTTSPTTGFALDVAGSSKFGSRLDIFGVGRFQNSGSTAFVQFYNTSGNNILVNFCNNNVGQTFFTIATNGNINIVGALSKGSGTFDIPHPILPEKRLVHSFIEGPRCDLIYRGSVQLSQGSALVNIDRDCTFNTIGNMTQGTFEALTTNPVCYLQNNVSFDRVKGTINTNILSILCENNLSNDTIDWMVIAERKDPFIKEWERTDTDGYLVTEYNTF